MSIYPGGSALTPTGDDAGRSGLGARAIADQAIAEALAILRRHQVRVVPDGPAPIERWNLRRIGDLPEVD